MIVLDSSAALEIAKLSEKGRAFQQLLAPKEEAIAPTLFTAEVANAAWKYVHANILDTAQAKQLLEDALSLPDGFIPVEDLVVEAYTEAAALGHSAYDMVYLVLARRNAATLFTCDRRLQECCQKRNVECVWETTL